MPDAPAAHLGDERAGGRFRDGPRIEGAGGHDLPAPDVPDPSVDHLTVETLPGNAWQ
jgi:hypothetical protein